MPESMREIGQNKDEGLKKFFVLFNDVETTDSYW